MKPTEPSQKAQKAWLGLAQLKIGLEGIREGAGWIALGIASICLWKGLALVEATYLLVPVGWLALWQWRELTKQKALLREVQLTSLRYQIQPHFLFNAMNNLATLVLEADRQRPHRMILNLSDFLRATLNPSLQGEVALREEIELTAKYLSIEEERLGDRLTVEWDIDPAALDFRLPVLLLQPLVENAIRHSIARSLGGGKLWIRAVIYEGRLRLIIEDWHRDRHVLPLPGTGIGLLNTRKRLESFYGGRAELHMFPLECGTRVEVHF